MSLFQIRFGDEDLLIDLEAFFKPVLTHLLNFERRIMTDLAQVNTQLDALTKQVADANAKTDQLIGVTTDLQALVKQFQSAVPITDADVQAVIDKIGVISSSVAAEGTKEDAAIAAGGAAPAPASGPTTDPLAAGTGDNAAVSST